MQKEEATSKKNIIYVSSMLPVELYGKEIDNSDKTDQQAQKFHRALVHGLIANQYKVIPLSYRRGLKVAEASETKGVVDYEENDIIYHFLQEKKSKFSRLINFFNCFRYIYRFLRDKSNSLVIADVLNLSVSLAAVFAAKMTGRTSIGIVTDVPGVYDKPGLKQYINKQSVKLFSKYILLTKQMNNIVNPRGKQYSVMEGIYFGPESVSEASRTDREKFVLIYAGTLDEQYGIKSLVESMKYVINESVELHIYGYGDYVDGVIESSKKDSRIIYHGVKDNREVVEAEKNSSLLVNPRSRKEMFTEYSFPSKTIEYMSTGVPVLMQELPGMPDEYKDYIYLYDGDDAKSIAIAISKIVGLDPDDLQKKGKEAQKFIIREKNAMAQVARITKELNI